MYEISLTRRTCFRNACREMCTVCQTRQRLGVNCVANMIALFSQDAIPRNVSDQMSLTVRLLCRDLLRCRCFRRLTRPSEQTDQNTGLAIAEAFAFFFAALFAQVCVVKGRDPDKRQD